MHIKIIFRMKVSKKLSLNNPKTFNEKIQCLKLYNRNYKFTIMADKNKIIKYVEKIIGKEYLIPLIGDYDKFDDIPFVRLDCYEANNKLYYKELLFCTASNYEKFNTEECDKIIGNLLKYPERKLI